MKQKIINIGNSAGVIIPKEYLDDLGLVVGEELQIRKAKDQDRLELYYKGGNESIKAVDARFAAMIDEIVERNKGMYKRLAE